MWSKKLYFFWESGSGECDDCGWYESLHLVVKNDLGEELLNEYGDSHLAGGDILYETTRIGFLLEKAGYGEGWETEELEVERHGYLFRINKPDGATFKEYVLGYCDKDESFDLIGKIFSELGHEVIQEFSTEKDGDWGV